MIEITVKTIWNGQVAVRGQYIQESVKTEQDIIIYHNHGSMKIPNHKLYEMIIAKSEHRVRDKYRKQKPDFLYYFSWLPDNEQGVLIDNIC